MLSSFSQLKGLLLVNSGLSVLNADAIITTLHSECGEWHMAGRWSRIYALSFIMLNRMPTSVTGLASLRLGLTGHTQAKTSWTPTLCLESSLFDDMASSP